MDFAVNQRRSYDGNLCTIRYVGKVEGTSGDWLGVEWDNPTRGKHSGEHNGVRYFTCISPAPGLGYLSDANGHQAGIRKLRRGHLCVRLDRRISLEDSSRR